VSKGQFKGAWQLFGIVVVGTSVYGLLQGYRVGETLIAATILSAFVVGIGWIGALAERRGQSQVRTRCGSDRLRSG
jgi:hypothetical protein